MSDNAPKAAATVKPGPRPAPPAFDPDPELIDHLEGNEVERRRYRRDAEQAREDSRNDQE